MPTPISPAEVAHPDTALTLAYAPPAARPALAALFALDERLAAIVARGAEPAIALIRLVWWRDALAGLATAPPPAEPLLIGLAASGLDGTRLATMVEGWEALIDDPDIAPETAADHARLRGATLFALAGTILAPGEVTPGGEGWALAMIGQGGAAAPLLADALRTRWPRRLRPLGLRVALAEFDLRAPDAPRRRMLRVLQHMLTGR